MGRCWQRSGSNRRRLVLQLLCWSLLVLLLVLLPPSCQASRELQPFKGRPLEAGAPNSFLGFLPRRPVPPSGPSRQHNSVGLESQRQKKP
ncbi:hypothetical protein HU200_027207 [Digitaria exilis]|uniref:Uncharacterized protein n=1 Tax=Digitaria exilis TaxID=1010633 RepID=A0A835BYF1_9POAL|nr:hypothetical protein HU200_027207 [Digitaria exilis]CAB3487017.1 unnamed protein product [Digitaria exilis]